MGENKRETVTWISYQIREHTTYMYNPSQALPGALHSVLTHLPSTCQHLIKVFDQGEECRATSGRVHPAGGHQVVQFLGGVGGSLHPVTAPQQLKQALHRNRGVRIPSQGKNLPQQNSIRPPDDMKIPFTMLYVKTYNCG